ncbi:MAG: hypothetical protein ACOX2U_02895 [Limisphaerales bacterium]|jgi:hypothetical protein
MNYFIKSFYLIYKNVYYDVMKSINKTVVTVILSGLMIASAIAATCQYCTTKDVEVTYTGDGGQYCTVVYPSAPTCAPSSWLHKCIFPNPKTYVAVSGTAIGLCNMYGPFIQSFATCETLTFSCGS